MATYKHIGIGAVICLGAVAATSACSNPETEYRILSVFFDGVPKPVDPNDQPETPVLAEAVETDELPMMPERRVFQHGPYSLGRNACTNCHATKFNSRLKVPKSEICRTCHTPEEMFEGEHWHPPALGGQCWGCHSPHTSEQPHLLLVKKSDICAKCHQGDTFVTEKRHQQKEWTQCLNCHDPHASDRRYMLRNSKAELTQ